MARHREQASGRAMKLKSLPIPFDVSSRLLQGSGSRLLDRSRSHRGSKHPRADRCTLGARDNLREEAMSLLIRNATVLTVDAGDRVVEDGGIVAR